MGHLSLYIYIVKSWWFRLRKKSCNSGRTLSQYGCQRSHLAVSLTTTELVYARQFHLYNKLDYTVWVGIRGNEGKKRLTMADLFCKLEEKLVCRKLIDLGYRYFKPVRKPRLSTRMMKQLLEWAKKSKYFAMWIGDHERFGLYRVDFQDPTRPRTAKESSKVVAAKETLRGHSDSSFRGEGYIECCVGVRLCDMYSNQELAEIHFMYGKADGNVALARRLYQERYPQRQCPDRKTFVRLHYRLCEYGKFNSPGLGRGRLRSTTPEVQEEILEAVNMTRRVALQVNVPHTTVWRLLKEYQLYPYHLQHVQALSPADYPARVRFCQWFLQQCGVNPNFPALVLFTDEAQFTRDGITNFHTQHVWAYENPRATVPSHHQVRFSLNMWASIIGDRLVGPHVHVNRLTGQAYTNFLENTNPHVLEDTPLINRQHIHFLHDGALAHFSRTARRYLG
ncbi:hypothetical protein ANN_12742 [Periplaneta americana]|uniref:DUF4817 domain-containing protein n=1 Tax=Periplaneta americana TaxID=6978 RepID=A0ABQ8TJF0_PERAM|nr:hypothetical protein ANN_12742 [Periplaneta americana]